MCIKNIKAETITYFQGREYQKKKDEVREAMIVMDLKYPTPNTGPLVPHPDYDSHLLECQKNFIDYAKYDMHKDNDRTLLFGDSIAAQARDYIDNVVDRRLNMSLGGMRAGHMLQLFRDMLPLFKFYGFVPNHIVVGTPDGNGLLQHYEIEIIKRDCIILFNTIRCEFPISRMELYGLPLTIVDYAIQHYAKYTSNIYRWVLSDGDSVFIPLMHDFVESMHIIMKANYSSDGVHLTPKGMILFGKLIERGKTDFPINRMINCY